jgi:hypothetical protein
MASGLTHTIGSSSFASISPAAERISLGAFKISFTYDVKRFHPPGTVGNFVVHNGRNGGRIVATNMYNGSLATVLADAEADQAAWEDTPVTIVLSSGTSVQRCLLEPGGMSIKQDPRASGRGGPGGDLCTAVYQCTFAVDS